MISGAGILAVLIVFALLLPFGGFITGATGLLLRVFLFPFAATHRLDVMLGVRAIPGTAIQQGYFYTIVYERGSDQPTCWRYNVLFTDRYAIRADTATEARISDLVNLTGWYNDPSRFRTIAAPDNRWLILYPEG